AWPTGWAWTCPWAPSRCATWAPGSVSGRVSSPAARTSARPTACPAKRAGPDETTTTRTTTTTTPRRTDERRGGRRDEPGARARFGNDDRGVRLRDVRRAG